MSSDEDPPPPPPPPAKKTKPIVPPALASKPFKRATAPHPVPRTDSTHTPPAAVSQKKPPVARCTILPTPRNTPDLSVPPSGRGSAVSLTISDSEDDCEFYQQSDRWALTSVSVDGRGPKSPVDMTLAKGNVRAANQPRKLIAYSPESRLNIPFSPTSSSFWAFAASSVTVWARAGC
jgi:hypothetical protein